VSAYRLAVPSRTPLLTDHDRVATARVARLATVRPDGPPHLVPVTFAMQGDTVVTAVDDKPKSTQALQRLANIDSDPRVSLLVDHYEDDWSRLWWIRLDGVAEVVRRELRRAELVEPLVAKYAAYREHPPTGPVINVRVETVTAWSAAG
jgi:PPOX class probable F420-dependent enzyme